MRTDLRGRRRGVPTVLESDSAATPIARSVPDVGPNRQSYFNRRLVNTHSPPQSLANPPCSCSNSVTRLRRRRRRAFPLLRRRRVVHLFRGRVRSCVRACVRRCVACRWRGVAAATALALRGCGGARKKNDRLCDGLILAGIFSISESQQFR